MSGSASLNWPSALSTQRIACSVERDAGGMAGGHELVQLARACSWMRAAKRGGPAPGDLARRLVDGGQALADRDGIDGADRRTSHLHVEAVVGVAGRAGRVRHECQASTLARARRLAMSSTSSDFRASMDPTVACNDLSPRIPGRDRLGLRDDAKSAVPVRRSLRLGLARERAERAGGCDHGGLVRALEAQEDRARAAVAEPAARDQDGLVGQPAGRNGRRVTSRPRRPA